MEITGIVTTGLGKAAYFLGQDFYKDQFNERLGFIPFPGTLNVKVSEEHLDEINQIRDNCENIIEPDEGFGAVKYVEAKINGIIDGAIVFPAKTTFKRNITENTEILTTEFPLTTHQGTLDV